MRGVGKRFRHRFVIAPLEVEACIVGRLVPDRGRAIFDRFNRIADRRQGFDIALDQFHRIAGLCGGFGNYDGDRITDMLYLADGHGRARRDDSCRPVTAFDTDGAGDVLDAVGAKVLTGMHRDNAGGRQG